MKKAAVILAMLAVYAAGAGEARRNGSEPATVLLDLELRQCDAGKGREIHRGLRKRLKNVEGISLVEGNGTGRCGSVPCAVEAGKAAGADRAIFGTVTGKRHVAKQRLSATGAGSYIVRTRKYNTYTITVKVVDVKSGRILGSISAKTGPGNIRTALNRIASRISVLFPPREIPEKEVPAHNAPPEITEHTPEESAPRNDEAEHAPPEVADTETPAARPCLEGAAYFSFMAPVGNFSDVISASLGNIIEGRCKDLYVSRSELRASFGYYYASRCENDVTGFTTMSLSALAGYRFPVTDRITITPLAGAGYHLHLVQNEHYGGTKRYLDPLLSVKCGIDYRLTERLSLTAAPGYSVFFESGTTGMYMSIDFGLKYSFMQ